MINCSTDRDGIATIEWDMASRVQNVLNEESIGAFETAVKQAIADSAVRGLLITSAKKDFHAGADLRMRLGQADPADVHHRMVAWNGLLRRMETAGKPVAAVMSGLALGGGLALALACHYRVATDSRNTAFAFPEVTLGLVLGGGGTQRLPRLIGIEAAMPLLTRGKRIRVEEALRLGVVQAVVPPGEERAAAREWLLGEGQKGASQPWDQPGFQIGGLADLPAPNPEAGASRSVQGRIMFCIAEGARTDFDTALGIEAQKFRRDSGKQRIQKQDSYFVFWHERSEWPCRETRRHSEADLSAGRHYRRGYDGLGHRLCGRHGRHRGCAA